MKIDELKNKLLELQRKLLHLEEVEGERIKQLLLDSDMGDDYRENEAAKLATAEQELWRMRKYYLKVEIIEIKKKLHRVDNI